MCKHLLYIVSRPCCFLVKSVFFCIEIERSNAVLFDRHLVWKQWRHHLFTLHILGKPLVSCSTRLIRTCTHINIHNICNLKVQHAHMYLISVKGRLLRCKKNNICAMQRKGLSAFFFQTLFLATLRTTWQGGCYCQGSVRFSPSHDYQIGYTWVVGEIAIKWGIFFVLKGKDLN